MSETDVRHVAVFVGHHNADDASAEVSEAHLHAVIVGDDIEGSRVADEVGGVETRERETVCALSVAVCLAFASCETKSGSYSRETEKKVFLHNSVLN